MKTTIICEYNQFGDHFVRTVRDEGETVESVEAAVKAQPNVSNVKTSVVADQTITITPLVHEFFIAALGEGYTIDENKDGDIEVMSRSRATEVVFYRGANGSICRVEMAGFRKPNGDRPGLYHFAVDGLRVWNVHNDTFKTESNTKLFKLMRAAVKEAVAPPAPTFKAGDRVKVVKPHTGGHDRLFAGSTGTVDTLTDIWNGGER